MNKQKYILAIVVAFFCCLPSSSIIAQEFSQAGIHTHTNNWKITFSRVISLFSHENPNYPLSKMKNLAHAVSSFQPSCVLGLLPYSEELTLSAQQVEASTFLRREIMATNPHSQFGVTMNLTRYPTATALVSKIQELNLKLAPDLFLLVVPKNNEVVYPSALAKGIQYIHEHGEAVGYEGPVSMIPDGVDFLVIDAEQGKIHQEEITSLRSKHRLPVLVRAQNFFGNNNVDNAESSLNELEQVKTLTRLAEEQSIFGYHFVYPLLSLLPMRQHDFHESAESSLLVRMRALMMRFN